MGKNKKYSNTTAPSNLTVNGALFETVRCELNDTEDKLYTAENAVESLTRVNNQLYNELKDAEQTNDDLNRLVSELQDDLDTVEHFQDATDLVKVNVITAEELFSGESIERCRFEQKMYIDFYEDHLRFECHHMEEQLDELRRDFCRLYDETIESGPVQLEKRDKRREEHIKKAVCTPTQCPTCPAGHKLTKHYSFPSRPRWCVHCSTALEPPGFPLYGCQPCGYDICQTCFDTPGATDRPLVDSEQFPSPSEDEWIRIGEVLDDVRSGWFEERKERKERKGKKGRRRH